MIVAVVLAGMVQPAVPQLVNVIILRHRIANTARAVRVARIAGGRIGMAVRMLGIDRDHMLLDMILMRVMQMPVVQALDAIAVANRRVSPSFLVNVGARLPAPCASSPRRRPRRPAAKQV